MRNINWGKIIQFSIVWIVKIQVTSTQNACNVSLTTLQRVSKCPATEEELQNAKLHKGCNSLAKIQKCVLPSDFVYHCVINFSRKETYEVCAPAIYSQGHCLEFNLYGKVIQELSDIDCVNLGCPKRFRSSNVLEYVQCSKLVDSAVTKDSSHAVYLYATFILTGILITALVTTTIYFVIRCVKKRRSRGNISTNADQQKYEQRSLTAGDERNEMDLSGQGKATHAIALANIATEHELHKDKGKNNKNSEDGNYLTIKSIGSTASDVSVKTGYDPGSYSFFLKKYGLKEFAEQLSKNGIDCIKTFLDLNEEKLITFGLNYGQAQKCLKAIEEVSKEHN